MAALSEIRPLPRLTHFLARLRNAAAVLEEKDEQQNDEDDEKRTASDVHLQPPFVSWQVIDTRSREKPTPWRTGT
jgi:hypothetical protein